MSDFHFDRSQVRRNFGRAASTYEKHDALQREVQSTLSSVLRSTRKNRPWYWTSVPARAVAAPR